MKSGLELLDTIRTRLQGRYDVLTRSLDLLEHEREIVRRELGLLEEVLTLEQERATSEVSMVPTTETASEPEPTVEGDVAPESRPPAGLAAEAQPDPELVGGPASVATAQLMPDPLPAEASDPVLRRVEALQRLRARLVADARVPDPLPPRTLNVGLLRRVEVRQRLGKS